MKGRMVREVLSVDHHRNGVHGEPFSVVLFRGPGFDEEPTQLVAVVFAGNGRVAVLDTAKTNGGDVAFGSNSFRGDNFELELRTAVEVWEKSRRS